MKYRHLLICASCCLLPLLTACQVLDASPRGATGYNRSTAPMETRAQFLQQAWVAAPYRGKPVKDHFQSVYIAPVNTRYMAEQTWWQQQGQNQATLSRDTAKFAARIRQQFQSSISNYPGDHIPLASGPGPGVLVIEVALVELVPSKAYWNAGATAAGFVVPGAGFLSAAGRGSIAIEGRARDGGTGKVIATFKDRRADKVAPVNLDSYTWYEGAEGNVTDWAAEFAELLNTPPNHVVKRPSPVKLQPW
jgi:hypothetical protein